MIPKYFLKIDNLLFYRACVSARCRNLLNVPADLIIVHRPKKIQNNALIFRYIREDKCNQDVNFFNRILLIEENLSEDQTYFQVSETLTFDEIKQKG